MTLSDRMEVGEVGFWTGLLVYAIYFFTVVLVYSSQIILWLRMGDAKNVQKVGKERQTRR